jgi:molecular chaperone Hsp33
MPIRGQWVRLEQVLTDMRARQDYPPNVAGLLAEMLAAVAMVADGIKFNGSVSLQSRGDGPLGTAMAECRQRHLLRCIGRWDQAGDPQIMTEPTPLQSLLGRAQLAITLVPDTELNPDAAPYQGMVGIEHPDLAHNLERYFEASEQLPTRLYFARSDGRVTGLLLQRLPADPGAPEMALEQHQAAWHEVQVLADTLERTELDAVAPDVLLGRLFAERPVRLQPPRNLAFSCTCNREKTSWTLESLPPEELLDLLESQGSITVTCEICGAVYAYDEAAVQALVEDQGGR